MFVYTLVINIMVMGFFSGQICAMNVTQEKQEAQVRADYQPPIKQIHKSQSNGTFESSDDENEGDEAEEKISIITCSCGNKQEAIKEEETTVFERDEKYGSALYLSTKDLLDAIKNQRDTQYELFRSKFIRHLVVQGRCFKCLTISLHEVVLKCPREDEAIFMAQKLILYGAVLNSYVKQEQDFIAHTPEQIASSRKFDKLAKILCIKKRAKRDE